MYVQKSGYCGYRGFQALSKKLALFCFFGQNPGARILRKFTREGTAVSSAPLLGICPPLGHSPFGPGRGDTAPFRAGRSPEHSGLCGARRAWAAVAGGTRGAGAAAQARPGALGAETGPCGRGGAAGGRFPGPGRRAACGPNAAKSGRGGRGAAAAQGGCVGGGQRWARGRGGGPGARRHSTLSVAACVGSGKHPVRAAPRRAGKALFRYIRKRAGRRAFVCQIRAVLA